MNSYYLFEILWILNLTFSVIIMFIWCYYTAKFTFDEYTCIIFVYCVVHIFLAYRIWKSETNYLKSIINIKIVGGL